MHARIFKLVNVVTLGLVAVLTHLAMFVCIDESASPRHVCTYGSPQVQLGLLFVIVLFSFFSMRAQQQEGLFWVAWRRNWLIGLFVGLALFSSMWTVFLPATIYRSLLLAFLALIAAYTGQWLSARGLVNFIAVVVGIFALASLLLAAILPDWAIMTNVPYVGLWRGIFWGKNPLGVTMALGYISYLMILFFPGRQPYTYPQKVLAAVMLVVCVLLAVLSGSASGLVAIIIETGLFAMLFAWLTWGHLIPRRGYWLLGACVVLGLQLLAINIDFVFSLFHRSADMTGRVPLWLYLLQTYVVKRPLFGYGFGAFWFQPGINERIQAVVGWGYGVDVSDNGFLDVWLGLGIVGLALLLASFAIGIARALRLGFRERRPVAFFPAFVLTHIALINMSLSYFIELESFIWFLFVVTLFMSSGPEKLEHLIGHEPEKAQNPRP